MCSNSYSAQRSGRGAKTLHSHSQSWAKQQCLSAGRHTNTCAITTRITASSWCANGMGGNVPHNAGHTALQIPASLSNQVTHKQTEIGGEIISARLFVQQGSPLTLLIVSKLRAGNVICATAQQRSVQEWASPARWATHSNKSRESDHSAHEQSSCSYCMLVLWLLSLFSPTSGSSDNHWHGHSGHNTDYVQHRDRTTSAHNVHFEPVPWLWPPQHNVLIMYTRNMASTPHLFPFSQWQYQNLKTWTEETEAGCSIKTQPGPCKNVQHVPHTHNGGGRRERKWACILCTNYKSNKIKNKTQQQRPHLKTKSKIA